MNATHRAICPLCEATCGLQVHTAAGQVQTIKGDHADPFSEGYLCPKGFALKALEEDPERLRQPLLRRGERWHSVGWEEAFALVEARLRPIQETHGRDAVGLYLGNPNVHNLSGQLYVPALARALGSRNVFSASTLDQMPKHVSCGLMFGDPMSIPIPDLNRTHFLLILGANPLVSNGSLMTSPNVRVRLKRIRERGGKIIVIDPRRTRTAEEASEHHFIRPGRDAFFLLGLLHTLFEENLVRFGPVAPHVTGVDEVRRAAAEFSPQRVSQLCGIPPLTIQRLARELAGAPTAAVYGRLGTCTQQFGTITSWLVDVVNILTGNLDRPGGAMFPRAAAGARNTSGVAGQGRGFVLGKTHSRVRRLPQVNGEFPTATLPDEILTPGPGQVKALITIAGNPALSAPNGARMSEALAALDFMISVDCYLNETTRFADLILPGPGHLQRGHYDVAFSQLAIHNYARYSPAVLPLAPGQLDEWEIVLRLAGVSDDMVCQALLQRELATPGSRIAGRDPADLWGQLGPRRGPERLLDVLLRVGPYGDAFGSVPGGLTFETLRQSPQGVDLGPLQPRVPELLRTPSGKIELASPQILGDLERLNQVQAAPGLVLIGRRDLRSNNSWMHNLPVLVKGPLVCTVMVHPDDARERGLQSGDVARVSTASGSVELAVEITDALMPGVISIPHGWGHGQSHTAMSVAQKHPGVNVNLLLSEQELEPLSGTAIQNAVPVALESLQPAAMS
jgi:anaerobic selenocysteine-containing dehydrogenase